MILEFVLTQVYDRLIPYVRMTQRGKHVKKNALEYLGQKESWGLRFKELYPGLEPLTDPLEVELIVIRRPMKKDRRDLDNIVKAVLDALNMLAWVDDTQVVSIQALSCFDSPCATERIITVVRPRHLSQVQARLEGTDLRISWGSGSHTHPWSPEASDSSRQGC